MKEWEKELGYIEEGDAKHPRKAVFVVRDETSGDQWELVCAYSLEDAAQDVAEQIIAGVQDPNHEPTWFELKPVGSRLTYRFACNHHPKTHDFEPDDWGHVS